MTTALDTGRLRLLREVGLRGSIAAAARSVGLTASAVSQQLALLERETGAALIVRSPRGVVLTGAGEALAARAGQVLDVLAAARADLDRLAGTVAGPVRLAAVASAAATFVSDATTGLRGSDPAIEVSVVAAEPEHAIGLLLRGDVDLAVVDEYDFVPLALPESAQVRQLDTEPLVFAGPIGLLPGSAPAGSVDVATLAGSPWVMPPESAACGRAVRAACRTAGFEPDVRWETDDMLLLARAVADGHGVAVLPYRMLDRRMLDRVLGPTSGDDSRVGDGLDVRPLRGAVLSRRLLAVARGPVSARPAVATVLDAVAAAVDAGRDTGGTAAGRAGRARRRRVQKPDVAQKSHGRGRNSRPTA